MSRKHRYYLRGIGVGIIVCALILIISRINTPADISDEEIITRARALGMVETGELTLTGGALGESGVSSQDTEPERFPVVSDPEPAFQTGEGNTDDRPGDGQQDTAPISDPVADEQGSNDQNADNDQTSGQPSAVQDTDEGNADNDQTSGQPLAGQDTDEGNAGDDQATVQPSEDQPSAGQEALGDYAVLTVERGNSSNVVADKLQRLGIIEDSRDFDKYLVDNGYATRISVGTFQIPYGSSYEFIAKTITRSL